MPQVGHGIGNRAVSRIANWAPYVRCEIGNLPGSNLEVFAAVDRVSRPLDLFAHPDGLIFHAHLVRCRAMNRLHSLKCAYRNLQSASILLLGLVTVWSASSAAPPSSTPKPVPLLQVIPLPNSEISFQRDRVELTRYYYATNLNRPFLYPMRGPSGGSLTRMGHPHDPVSHSHHNSVWISHHDVNGLSSWEDRGVLRILHQRIEELKDGDDSCSATVLNQWVNPSGTTVIVERRRMTAHALPRDEWLLEMDLRLDVGVSEVTFGKTPFGLVGVRMAKTIGVNDGGGTIRNSDGRMNEQEVFWKPARWVDYSGPIRLRTMAGIALMDHPANPNHPSVFHVRNDGWMGASLTFDAPRVLKPGAPLILRYGLYVHGGMPSTNAIQRQWLNFAARPIDELPDGRKR